jgi:hypothetical protein
LRSEWGLAHIEVDEEISKQCRVAPETWNEDDSYNNDDVEVDYESEDDNEDEINDNKELEHIIAIGYEDGKIYLYDNAFQQGNKKVRRQISDFQDLFPIMFSAWAIHIFDMKMSDELKQVLEKKMARKEKNKKK